MVHLLRIIGIRASYLGGKRKHIESASPAHGKWRPRRAFGIVSSSSQRHDFLTSTPCAQVMHATLHAWEGVANLNGVVDLQRDDGGLYGTIQYEDAEIEHSKLTYQ